ncbi:cell surface protein [Lactobacillus johnsonii]|uniref:aggregation-promoting factor n=1 Tax=Lactobacillus johnsonii TaxID=33959 RepID=UPI00107223F6|nr:cell surface protein [Lactobacillus johnsonii]MBF0771428.1 cell surface protein [Lactobacillus johnsonii]MCF1583115.1 cell surface protein [Lactobacillus johnsonii]MDG4988346.1 cell surface protein [Lactobacillus johnsonii]NDO44944.1 cell surface protein [Lactobacillus johnsonii]QMT67796.1 cell surface protein [Lactobacillus johnsonii]
MKFQSILTKSLAAAALTATGLVALNSQNTNDAQAATIVQNDTNVVTINNANSTVAVWDGVENANFTGKELVHGTTWKVIRTAYDVMGNKWYDLGANQWIMAKYTVEGGNAASAQVATPVAPQAQAPVQQVQPQTTVQAPVQQKQQTAVQAQAPKTNYNYNVQRTYSAPVQQRTYSYAPAQKQTTQVAQPAQTQATTSYTSNVSGSEAAAKAWIAGRESGGSYSARNGQYIGKYQLSASYLGGDYSAANQERVADNYVKSRYGSWTGAQKFWQTNGWY